MIEFTIPGPPIGKARARFARIGNFVRTYTPDVSEKFENLVKLSFLQVHNGPPIDGPVSVSISAYFPIPKSWTKKRLAAHQSKPEPVIKRPDIDNVVKSVLDGLNGIAFKDDSQVFMIVCRKYYSDQPQTIVAIGSEY